MKRLTSLLTALIIVLVIVGAAVWFFFFRSRALTPTDTAGNSEYSAVALNSNELFFGKITKQDATQLVLEDVYFFTFVPDGANGATNGSTATTTTTTNGSNQNLRPTLIDTSAKDSIAPTRVYVFNRDQIKYTYPLKSDASVIKTIDEYKKKGTTK